jgi:hypothetical protein
VRAGWPAVYQTFWFFTDSCGRRDLLKKGHFDADGEEDETKDASKGLMGEMDRPTSAQSSAEEKPHGDEGRHPKVHVTLAVVGPDGENTDGKEEDGQGGPLGLVLTETEEEREDRDHDDPAAHAHQSAHDARQNAHRHINQRGDHRGGFDHVDRRRTAATPRAYITTEKTTVTITAKMPDDRDRKSVV